MKTISVSGVKGFRQIEKDRKNLGLKIIKFLIPYDLTIKEAKETLLSTIDTMEKTYKLSALSRAKTSDESA